MAFFMFYWATDYQNRPGWGVYTFLGALQLLVLMTHGVLHVAPRKTNGRLDFFLYSPLLFVHVYRLWLAWVLCLQEQQTMEIDTSEEVIMGFFN